MILFPSKTRYIFRRVVSNQWLEGKLETRFGFPQHKVNYRTLNTWTTRLLMKSRVRTFLYDYRKIQDYTVIKNAQ